MNKVVNDFNPPMKVEFPSVFMQIWEQVRPYTMVPQYRFIENLALIQHFGTRLEGAFVECGTWRGGMSAAMIALGGPARSYHFFDSFEGLPPAKEIDGPGALNWQARVDDPGYYDNCRAQYEDFVALIRRQPVPSERVSIHKGWFEETVPHQAREPIAVLRLDGDWYESTMVCLENLYPRLVPGGLMIIDDYADWDGCSRAVHDYLSRQKSATRIDRTPLARVTYLLKAD